MQKCLENALLFVVSVLLCTVLAEGAVRVADDHSLFELRLSHGPSIGHDTTLGHLDEVPRADGVDRAWFFNEPGPLPNRHSVPREWVELDRQMQLAWKGRDLAPWEYFRAWNAAFVGDPCAGTFFRQAPSPLYVFELPQRLRRPIYRYMPNATTPMGLVTNQFGWRGAPVEFQRSERTVRIVFIGASTTAGAHVAPFSYPELVGHWIKLWAAARHPGIGFEVLNAGRESITSPDTVEIIRHEVAPMRPDLVVYYEGANQFQLKTVVKDMPVNSRPHDLNDSKADPTVPWMSLLLRYLALARRVQALTGASDVPDGGVEPKKPDYDLVWPAGVDEFDPDIERPDLPVNLSTIRGDLDQIRADLAVVDSELAVSSFVWLVKDGMTLNPIRNRIIWDYLNTTYFPYRYRDMERLAKFQNRVFAKYASSRGIAFFDVARAMPFDPDLFTDAIHNTYPGMRLQAWIMLQQLLPLVENRLASGAWPKPVPVMGSSHPAFQIAPRELQFACRPAQ